MRHDHSSWTTLFTRLGRRISRNAQRRHRPKVDRRSRHLTTEQLEPRCLLAVGGFLRLDGIPPGGVPFPDDLAAAENTHAHAIYYDQDDYQEVDVPGSEPPYWHIESTDELLAYVGSGVNAVVTDAMSSATTQALAEVPTPIGNSIVVPQVNLAAIQMAMSSSEKTDVSIGLSSALGVSESILYTPFQFQAPAGQESNPFLYRGFIHLAAGGIVVGTESSSGSGNLSGGASVGTQVPFPLNVSYNPSDPPPPFIGMRVWLGTTLLAEAYIDGGASVNPARGETAGSTGLWNVSGQVRELDGTYSSFWQNGLSSAQVFLPFAAKIFDGNVITYDADPNRNPLGFADKGGIGGFASAGVGKYENVDEFTLKSQGMTLQAAGAWGFADPFVNPPPILPPPQIGTRTAPADINGDGVVDQNDFNVLSEDIKAWGEGNPSRLKKWMKAQVEASQGDAFIVTIPTDADNGDDSYYDLSLREALSLAQDGDKIYFAPWVHEIDLTSELVVTEDVQIIGSGADWLRLDGGGTTRVLKVNSGVTASVSGLTIKRGYTTSNGGGIYSTGNLTLDSVEVVDCDAGVHGGGVAQVGGSLQMMRSTIAENTAALSGGGLYINGSNSAIGIDKSTISSNEATSGGGVFISAGNSTITFTNATVTGNHITSKAQGGGICNETSTKSASANVRLRNSIVVGNTNKSGNAQNLTGTFNGEKSSYNLIGTGDTFLGGDGNQFNVTPAQAALGPLTNNGGSTRTHALLTGSWAIDSGSNAIAGNQDQRGHTRPIDIPLVSNGTGGAADIGAYEADDAGSGASLSVLGLNDMIISEYGVGHDIAGKNLGTSRSKDLLRRGFSGELSPPTSVGSIWLTNGNTGRPKRLIDYGGITQTHIPLFDNLAVETGISASVDTNDFGDRGRLRITDLELDCNASLENDTVAVELAFDDYDER